MSDYIRRQDAIDYLGNEGLITAMVIIDRVPSADVSENRTGKWIDKDTATERFIPRYRCSLCGGFGDNTNFCPNCGADMRGNRI